MNIAIGALMVIILLMPEASLIKGFYTSLKRKESAILIPFQDLLLRGLVFSIPIHVTALCLIKLFGGAPQTATLYNILEGSKIDISEYDLTGFIIQFCTYSLILISFCFFAGKSLKLFVERNKMDVHFHALRTTNYWYQIFSGRYLERYGAAGKYEDIDFIFIDHITESDIIYSGFLDDFHFSKTKDELECIILSEVRKGICFTYDEDGTKKHKVGPVTTVPGDVLIKPAGKIKNINVTYCFIEGEVSEEVPFLSEPGSVIGS